VAVDWSTEWLTSIVWILGVTVAAALGSWLIGWLLARSTVWGRQFARLTTAYFSPRGPEGWQPLLTALLLLLLTIFLVRINVLLSYSNNGLLTALQQLDTSAFARYLGIFGVLATIYVVITLVEYYVQQRLVIRWWSWLTGYMVGDWLADAAYARRRLAHGVAGGDRACPAGDLPDR
jgi:putative ATP-binding cassette transporter